MLNIYQGKEMIRNFIYLDEDKMYSLSSQLFEGVTEYVLNESYSEKEEHETQKGPVGSGRVIGDILRNKERNTEKKFLNDYSYTIFEKKLIDEGKVLTNETLHSCVGDGENDKFFIKIKSTAIFNDMNSIVHTMKNFNKIGQALTRVTTFEEVEKLQARLRELNEVKPLDGSSKKEKIALEARLKKLADIDGMAKSVGMQKDQKFLDDLSFMLSYGFQDQLEVQLDVDDFIVTSNLNREHLRESEELVVRRYSRKTEIKFTLFGIITQCNSERIEDIPDAVKGSTLKEALMTLVAHLTKMESSFIGRLPNEIIVEPIALYTEI